MKEMGVNPTFENYHLAVNAVKCRTVDALMAFLPKSEQKKMRNRTTAKKDGDVACRPSHENRTAAPDPKISPEEVARLLILLNDDDAAKDVVNRAYMYDMSKEE